MQNGLVGRLNKFKRAGKPAEQLSLSWRMLVPQGVWTGDGFRGLDDHSLLCYYIISIEPSSKPMV